MDSKSQQKAVVMGGSSGIGLASAHVLNTKGFSVTVTGRNPEKLAKATHGTSIASAVVDAASDEAVSRFFENFGPVDHVVITLSGAKGAGPFPSVGVSQLQEGFTAKFFAHWRVAQAALPKLSPHGSLTFVSAISARCAMPGTVGLAAINGAIEAMIKPLAREIKPRRVNAVSPGVIETPWWDAVPQDQRKKLLDSTAAASVVGRNGRPEEVADAIAFLVTNEFVTGTIIEIDGGIRFG